VKKFSASWPDFQALDIKKGRGNPAFFIGSGFFSSGADFAYRITHEGFLIDFDHDLAIGKLAHQQPLNRNTTSNGNSSQHCLSPDQRL
jgi:hypothetical protein